MHSELTEMGKQRIMGLLQQFPENRKVSVEELGLRAKYLQAMITGTIVVMHSENLSVDQHAFVETYVESCVRAAKGKG